MLSSENDKIKELINQYNHVQIITEPTHFTEQSSTLIDVFLIRNETNMYIEVTDPFIPDQVRYHCPKKVREKSRKCHNHKPQPFPDPKRKRKPTNLNKHKPNKRTKSTKNTSLAQCLTSYS